MIMLINTFGYMLVLFYELTHRSLLTGEGNGTPLQYSCLENPMDQGAWWATVHEIAESDGYLSYFFQFLDIKMNLPQV